MISWIEEILFARCSSKIFTFQRDHWAENDLNACVCVFVWTCTCDFWLSECVASSAHTPVKYTHVERLSSRGLDSSLFHGCDRSKHQSVSHPALQRGVHHSFVLRDSKPSSLPPHVLLSLPLSSVDLGLPFDPLPTWTCSPIGQLWARIQHFFIATACGHTPRGIHVQKWQTDACGSEMICIFPNKMIGNPFLPIGSIYS